MSDDNEQFSLEDFLSDPKHKPRRDVLFGVVDHRLKEIIEQRVKEKEKGAPPAKEKTGKSGGSFAEYFDWLFGKDEK